MSLKSFILTTAMSSVIVSWSPQDKNSHNIDDNLQYNKENILSLMVPQNSTTQEDLFVCLETDKDSYTHTNVLENIPNTNSKVILEYPVSQIFKTYGKRSHPLAVSWVSRTLWSFLWKTNFDEKINAYPQSLSSHTEEITTSTRYAVSDTIRFWLIDSGLEYAFESSLKNQLQEKWFEKFSDKDSLTLNSKNKQKYFQQNFKQYKKDVETDLSHDYIYDIVVKKLNDWRSALAVYRDWKLFMATYVSVGLPSKPTITGEFSVLAKRPYYCSKKYKSPMPFWLEFDHWWFYFHQGNVTGKPASHWCVRLPWAYASVLYSLVNSKDNNTVDVFIDKNLYKS